MTAASELLIEMLVRRRGPFLDRGIEDRGAQRAIGLGAGQPVGVAIGMRNEVVEVGVAIALGRTTQVDERFAGVVTCGEGAGPQVVDSHQNRLARDGFIRELVELDDRFQEQSRHPR